MTTFKRAVRVFMVVAAGMLAYSGTLVSSAGAATAKPKHGGTLTMLQNSGVWTSLDPATDVDSGQDTYFMSAIYGQLFELGPKGTIIPTEAQSYKFSNKGLTVDIILRPGIQFSDGTPFNAQAVAASIATDLVPANNCICLTNFTKVTSVTAVGKYDVRLQLSSLDSAIINDFIDTATNWTVSPTAFASEGASQFGTHPVGAGPFMVTSDEPSASLDMVRNPHYFVKGEPYLAGLDVEVTSSDQSDFDALQTGEAQASVVTTTTIFQQAKTTPGLKTYKFPATAPDFVRINTLVPPFNNLLAREAISYATNPSELVKQLYGGLYTTVQGYLTPAQFFYTPKVPDYRGYNLAKAKKLVSQIPGGLTVSIDTTNNTQASVTETEAIAAQWQLAGINATVSIQTSNSSIALRENHAGWQAMDGGYLCGVDPSGCTGVNLSAAGLFSAIHDPIVDGLLNQGTLYVNPATRARVYLQLDQHLNQQAEMVWLYGKNGLLVTTSSVQGINPAVAEPTGLEDWETIWLK